MISRHRLGTAETTFKALWKKTHHPDNYTHVDAFLASLQTNANFRSYTYWPLVLLTFAVTQQFAIIFLFLDVFVWLKDERLDPRSSLLASIICYAASYTSYALADGVKLGQNTTQIPGAYLKNLKSSVLVFFALLSLSPVLSTLTSATYSDSIWALAAILFCVHIILGDYHSTIECNQTHLSSVLSINAALSASVVLASRLPSDTAVFALVLLSVEAFALFPSLRRRLQVFPESLHATWTFILTIATIWMTATVSRTVAMLYGALFLFITFAAPGLLIWAQKYKNEIRGPWDVAIPKLNMRT